MTFPEWADATLSEGLLVLVAQGEGQALEFMVAFPEQVRELAKEIAAFATSNAGTMLLGVNDAGDIMGLVGVVDAKGRDALIRRIEGICSGSVKPAITPTARWAIVDGRTVLALSVPKGRQPVYYAGNIPYLRHITQARPAEPHEVLELVRESVSALVLPPSGERDAVGMLLSTLAPVVVDILIYCDEAESRLIILGLIYGAPNSTSLRPICKKLLPQRLR